MLAAAADTLLASSAGRSMAFEADDRSANERELVNAARQGDRAAFARLHERYARMVHGMALARVPVSDAADLVQDVFLEAMRKLHTLRDPSAFGPWLAMIARNLARDFYRRTRSRNDLTTRRKAPGESSAHDATGEALRILGAIQSLPETYSESLMLRLVEGLTGPQIAACTGMTAGSVRVNLHRGMQLLQEKLASIRRTEHE